MDIIPLDRFQEKLTEDLLDIKRVNRKNSWSDLLTHWVAQHFLHLENSQGLRACGMQGSGEEGIDLFWVQDGSNRVIVGQAEAGTDLNLQGTFAKAVGKLLKGLDKWVERATKKQKREIGSIDIRKIFISSATFQKITNDGVTRSLISKVQKQLPPLN
jgi:hypothetical protein